MLIIGEKINVMNNAVYEAIRSGDLSGVIDLAERQVRAGAHVLDINIGPDTYDGGAIMRELVTAIQNSVSVQLCLNGSSEIIESGLRVHKGRAFINGVTPEKSRAFELLRLAKTYGARAIGMALPVGRSGDVIDNICNSAMEIIGYATDEGLEHGDLYIDPVLPSFGICPDAVNMTAKAVKTCRDMLPGIKTIAGLSNLSAGVRGESRSLMNKTALSALMAAGIDAVIMNPLDRATIDTAKTGQILYHRGIYCEAYLEA